MRPMADQDQHGAEDRTNQNPGQAQRRQSCRRDREILDLPEKRDVQPDGADRSEDESAEDHDQPVTSRAGEEAIGPG